MQKWKISLVALLALILLLPSYYPSLFKKAPSPEAAVEQFKITLSNKSEDLRNQLLRLKELRELGELDFYKNTLSKEKTEKGLSFYIYKHSDLIYWSENTHQLNKDELFDSSSLYITTNSFYKKIIVEEGSFKYVGLILLYQEYPLKNKYLKSGFAADFEYELIKGLSIQKNEFPLIENEAGEGLLFATFNSIDFEKKVLIWNNFLLFIGLLLLIFVIYRIAYSSKYSAYFYIATTLLVRFLLFVYKPETIVSSEFFQSNKLAFSTFIPSLGDLALHLIALFIIIYQLNKIVNNSKNCLISLLHFALSLVMTYLSVKLISISISASQITFNLNNLFKLNEYSLIILLCFCLLFIISIISLSSSVSLINRSFSKNSRFFIKVLGIAVYLLVLFIGLKVHWIYWSIVPLFLLINFYFSHSNGKKLVTSGFILILSTAVIAFWVNFKIESKQRGQSDYILQKLAEERDPVAEFLFNDIQNQLSKDSLLLEKVGDYWSNKKQIDQYLKETYFDSYWNRYLINFSICESSDFLYINEWETSVSCYSYYENRIRSEGNTVSSSNLFQLQNLAGRIDYIGEISLKKDTLNYRLYIELSANYFSENEGYPELLLDDDSQNNKIDLSAYSYAVYNKNLLVFNNGEYNYSITPKLDALPANSYYKYQSDGFIHSAYQKHENTLIILSSPNYAAIDFLTAFAYLTVLFSLLFFSFALSLKNFPFYFNPNFRDFSTKILLYLIGSLLMALVFVAIGSNYYITEQYREKNINNLKEKLRSIRLELETSIGQEDQLSNNKDFSNYLSSLLIRFSNIFYTDINFYDLEGNLYSSSRPEVFEKTLKSKRMDPLAFYNIVEKEKAEWVQNEKIGELQYLSAYKPFVNYNNEIIGYVNLPYFVKQGKLQEEISNFLVSVINIYVAIFVLSLFISILLINQLSKPLLLIRKQIARLKIGSSIELIEWDSKDEIGALVNEYNRIAIELNESAEELAKSEREGAWREMAKQVAHEIKNPLTPMKLSIQHLQLAAKSNSPDLNERIKKTCETIIQQIDSLSNIASAFSAFAKLPEKSLKEIDLIPLIKNIINLFSADANIQFATNGIKSAVIFADKDQLLRLLNNIMKNAVQASKEGLTAEIFLDLSIQDEFFKLSVKDMGIGIEDDKLEKIFEPNFTTKSSGTGLGLALSKNILEQMGGKIEVSSELGMQTTFSIYFRIA
tara:strand:- start:16652 stop:20248 length:3597 start_codon:yes stop_codon:yes gene_type:complete